MYTDLFTALRIVYGIELIRTSSAVNPRGFGQIPVRIV